MNSVIRTYLKALESGDAATIIELFTTEGIVYSPLYGRMKAQEFYKDLFNDTANSSIKLLNTFESSESPFIIAAHFIYCWTMKDGAVTQFECVDIFSCDSDMKIMELRIIYDTAKTRRAFENLSSKSTL